MQKLHGADFALVVYSGHGFIDRASGESFLALSAKDEQLPVRGLATTALRQLVVLDSCRNYAAGLSGLLTEGLRPTQTVLTVKQARSEYDRWVMQAEAGWVACYGCHPDKSSFDSPGGGHFSNALFGVAHDWALTPSQFAMLPINVACVYGDRRLPAENQQHPLVRSFPQPRKRWFPFALRKANYLA